MSASESAGWRRVPIQLAVAVAVATGIGGAFAGAAIANDDGGASVEPAAGIQAERASTQVQAAEQAQLRAIVVKMPSGWVATDVMWRAAAQPQRNTAAAHQDWRQAATLMPSGWPATDVMRRAAADGAR